jgi:hypothetical protein
MLDKVFKKPLFKPKNEGKGGRNKNELVLKVGCNIKIKNLL